MLPVQINFLGGGLYNYLQSPYLWAWANFDGEHYLFIAQSGYQALTYFFFPLYPKIVGLMGNAWEVGLVGYLYSGLIISNFAFLVGLFGITKLVRLDYSENVVKLTLTLLLLFPTAFYFGAVYTEGIFFALIVWSFYYARTGNWAMAGLLGAAATGTRITGLALFPALIAEYYFVRKCKDIRDIISILLTPLGTFLYMVYLHFKAGDYLAFFHNLTVVYGEQRSGQLILLPRVFYRYFWKILPNLNYSYIPVIFTTYLELFSALLIGVLIYLGIAGTKKMRESYLVFSVFAYLIPTFSGSFSSFPRYVLIIFPVFILAAAYLDKMNKLVRYSIFILSLLLQAIATALFIRGYWVS